MSNYDHESMGPKSPIESSGHSFGVHSPQSRRSRSNSYPYSDSFDSEDSGQDTRQVTPAARKGPGRGQPRSNGTTPRRSTKSNSSASTNVGRTNKKKPGIRRGTGTKSLGNSTSRNMSLTSTTQQSPRSNNEIHQRMLSAKDHTISRLRNELEELKQKQEEALGESRLLKQVQRRQERALSKYQGDDAELPQLLKKHSAELDSLNRRIRKYQQRDKEKERQAKDQHEQLMRAKDELRRLQDLAADRGLKDRDHLRKRADKLEEEVNEKNSKLTDLERYVENMKKNHRHTEHQWRVKELDIKNRLRDAETERDHLRYRLKETEKELDVRNIYSNRFTKFTPRGRAMSQTTPLSLSAAKSVSADELRDSVSPRREVRQDDNPTLYEEKRPRTGSFSPENMSVGREEGRQRTQADVVDKGFEEKDPLPVVNSKLPGPAKAAVDEKKVDERRVEDVKEQTSEVEQDISTEGSPRRGAPRRPGTYNKEGVGGAEVVEDEHLRILRMLDADVQNLEGRKVEPDREDKKTTDDISKKGKVFGSTDSNTYKPTWLFGNKAEEESNEKAKKTSQLKKDPDHPMDTEAKKEGEEESFPFFGSTRPANKRSPPAAKQSPSADSQSSSGGVVNSVRDLHKYSKTDETKKNSVSGGIVFNSDWKTEVTGSKQNSTAPGNDDDYQKKKEHLLQRMKETDITDEAEDRNGSGNSGKSSREYSFSRPIENLHHGRPSHPELSPKNTRRNQPNGQRRKSKENIDIDELSFGSYAPSFSKEAVDPKPKQGQNGMKEKEGRSSFGGGSVFSTSTKAKPVSDAGGLPWETNSQTNAQTNSRTNSHGAPSNGAARQQGTLFATMPYNQRTGPFAAKPIAAVGHDDLDDDLEELVLN